MADFHIWATYLIIAATVVGYASERYQLELVAFASLACSFWPWMIPYSVTVLDAAAPLQSLTFLFYGAGLVVFPVVLAYTIGVYAIFRGKLHDGYD